MLFQRADKARGFLVDMRTLKAEAEQAVGFQNTVHEALQWAVGENMLDFVTLLTPEVCVSRVC